MDQLVSYIYLHLKSTSWLRHDSILNGLADALFNPK
jgi:hypothetical protein